MSSIDDVLDLGIQYYVEALMSLAEDDRDTANARIISLEKLYTLESINHGRKDLIQVYDWYTQAQRKYILKYNPLPKTL